MSDLTPNSDTYKNEEDRPVKSLVNESAPIPANKAKQFENKYLKDDFRHVKQKMKSIIGPSVRDLLYTMATTAFQMILFGDDGNRGGYSQTRRDIPRSNYNYGSVYRRDVREPDRTPFVERTADFEVIGYKTKVEADDVLAQLRMDINEYGKVSVARYYDYSGYTTDNYALRNWGWYDLNLAETYFISRAGKWAIDLPRIQSLK